MTLMKSRRRIVSPKARDTFDLAFSTAITAGISERQNGLRGQFAGQQLRAANTRPEYTGSERRPGGVKFRQIRGKFERAC
jgi:hypothetical protein